jgi:hypothetical protein
LATVIVLLPTGPGFLHIQHKGASHKVVDHTEAKLCQLEVVQVASPRTPASAGDSPSAKPAAPTAAPQAPQDTPYFAESLFASTAHASLPRAFSHLILSEYAHPVCCSCHILWIMWT